MLHKGIFSFRCFFRILNASVDGVGMYSSWNVLTLNAPITIKFVCFCHLLKCFRSLQSDLGPHCLSQNLTLSNNVSKNLQQTTNADRFSDDIFAGLLRIKNAPLIDWFKVSF